LSVLLLEKGDWGAGTSGASSWMIHGGPRYLEYDWDTTRLSCVDAGHIVTIARNLVYRVVFLIPVLPHDRNNIEPMEPAMEVYDLIQDGGKVIGVRSRSPDGEISEARARVVVNATGPWSPEVAGMAGVEVHLRPAKGVHIVYPHRISNFSISAESVDGRDLLM